MDHSRPILVVEDDDDTRAMVTTVLELDGHDVITAANGKEGFERARQDHPCLILLDLMMPVMNGEQFRAAQLADPSTEDIPVVVLSAHHDALAIAKRMKVAGCLQKPVDFDELHDIVKRRCAE